MKTRLVYVLVGFLFGLLVLAGIHIYFVNQSDARPVDVLVGVDVAYDNMESLKKRVDEVKSYTNFFIVGSYGITFNETKLNDVCQYIYDSGLSFAIFAHTNRDSDIPFNQSEWSYYAADRWGKRFWGLYAYDEPGGHQIDDDVPFMVVTEADNYSDAADKYVENLTRP